MEFEHVGLTCQTISILSTTYYANNLSTARPITLILPALPTTLTLPTMVILRYLMEHHKLT